MNKIRNDIQILRAIAVLGVVFYHFDIFSFHGGYLGVDVFFVISGFLVTRILAEGISNNSISVLEFYIRRAKRLLPAAYTTLLITTFLSFFILTSKELNFYYLQLLGALTFSANFFLLKQGDYFGGESALKPLLHTWSLSVEEQYYFILPILLILITKRFWLFWCIALIFLSFVACIYIQSLYPAVSFYLLPFRAWELGIGSLIAIYNFSHKKYFSNYVLLPSYLVLFYLLINPISKIHPGIDALLVSICTAIIIISKKELPQNILTKALSYTGDISYSLYLIHWPIQAILLNVLFGQDINFFIKTILFLLSFLLAHFQYRYIEVPFRTKKVEISKLKLANYFLPAAVSIIFLLPPLYISNQNDSFFNSRASNPGFSYECSFDDRFLPIKQCSSGNEKKILIWGDSNAMHLQSGISQKFRNHEIIQATKFACAPFANLASVGKGFNSFQTLSWAKSCIAFNNSVLEYIKENNDIEFVIISSALRQYLDLDSFLIVDANGESYDSDLNQRLFVLNNGIQHTINFLNDSGIKHLIVGPPPALDFDLGRCAERKIKKLITFGNYSDCKVSKDEAMEFNKNIVLFQNTLRQNNKINFVDLYDLLIVDNFINFQDKANLYIENAHLSYEGSSYVINKIDFNEFGL